MLNNLLQILFASNIPVKGLLINAAIQKLIEVLFEKIPFLVGCKNGISIAYAGNRH